MSTEQLFAFLQSPQAINMAFVCAVALASGLSILRSSSSSADVLKQKAEILRDLEASLRSLIEEATTASTQLNSELLKRQQEIESLLARDLSETRGRPEPGPSDLPNDSYLRPLRKKQPEMRASLGLHALEERETDTVSFSHSALETARARLNQRPAPAANPQGRSVAPSDSSPVSGSVVLKIARRLLSQGQEIHIVARKLELPLEEVRMLDRLVRAEQKPADDSLSSGSEHASQFESAKFTARAALG